MPFHRDELFVQRLRRALRRRRARRIAIPGFVRAVTLVPIVSRPGGPVLVFTERSASLPSHAGQISFPGGRRERQDRTPRDTALREAREELAIAPESVDVLGRLDDVATYTGFVITPVVGWLSGPAPFRPDRREVRSVLEVPLSRIGDPARFASRGSRTVAGRRYAMGEFRVAGVTVWGATARMVHCLLKTLGWPKAASLF
ncbi:MAG: CoA pyrophosphatase [Elusimicrobia bacterium]|nr:CoA pyrophosphatase [Elusimicrobiota bacterium]